MSMMEETDKDKSIKNIKDKKKNVRKKRKNKKKNISNNTKQFVHGIHPALYYQHRWYYTKKNKKILSIDDEDIEPWKFHKINQTYLLQNIFNEEKVCLLLCYIYIVSIHFNIYLDW